MPLIPLQNWLPFRHKTSNSPSELAFYRVDYCMTNLFLFKEGKCRPFLKGVRGGVDAFQVEVWMISPLDLEGNMGHGCSFSRGGQVLPRPYRCFDINPFTKPASDVDRGVFVRMAFKTAVRIHAGEAGLGGVG